MRLLLASASPRRAELLRAAGFQFDVQPADVDEAFQVGESPEGHVGRLAEAKAEAVLNGAGERVVLAADTVVVIDDLVLGKPADARDATRMLRLLSGRRHRVLTGVAVVVPGPGQRRLTRVEATTVELAALTSEDVAWYVGSGEPADKAGGYAVQGLASRFVTRIEGSYSNVVGLPVALVHAMLKEVLL